MDTTGPFFEEHEGGVGPGEPGSAGQGLEQQEHQVGVCPCGQCEHIRSAIREVAEAQALRRGHLDAASISANVQDHFRLRVLDGECELRSYKLNGEVGTSAPLGSNGRIRTIIRIAVANQILNQRRRKEFTHRRAMPGAVGGDTTEDDPATLAGLQELREGCRQALVSLPPEVRIVVVWRLLDGLTRQEIAERLETTQEVVRGRESRGVEVVRDALRRFVV